MTPQAERARQKAFNEAADRILKARLAIDPDKLAKMQPSPILDGLAASLDESWKACRAGRHGAFLAALHDWERESLKALYNLAEKK